MRVKFALRLYFRLGATWIGINPKCPERDGLHQFSTVDVLVKHYLGGLIETQTDLPQTFRQSITETIQDWLLQMDCAHGEYPPLVRR
jgi:hypothetical protein